MRNTEEEWTEQVRLTIFKKPENANSISYRSLFMAGGGTEEKRVG
jgi:hypothetical protein